MFSSELEKYSWEDITACIASKRSRDVEIALVKSIYNSTISWRSSHLLPPPI